VTATRPRIPTAACYREVTATRLTGLFTQSLPWVILKEAVLLAFHTANER